MGRLRDSNSTFITSPLGPAVSPPLCFPLSGTVSSRLLADIHTRQRVAIRGCAFFALLSFSVETLKNVRDYELQYAQDMFSILLSYTDYVCLAVVLLFLVKYYQCQHAICTTWVGGKMWRNYRLCVCLAAEVVLLGVVSPPAYNPVFNISAMGGEKKLSLGDVFYPACLLRLYHLLRFLYSESDMCSPEGLFRLNVVKLKAGMGLYMKYLALRKYHIYSFAFLGVLVGVSGLILMVFERNALNSPFESESAGFYCGGIAMATIGYGDVLPGTHLGRGVVVLVSILGNYAQAVLTLGVRNTVIMSSSHSALARLIYKRTYQAKPLRQLAVIYLQRWWRLHFLRRHGASNRFIQIHLLENAKFRFRKEIYKSTEAAALHFSQSIHSFYHKFTQKVTFTKEKLSIDPSIFEISADLCDFHLKLLRSITTIKRKSIKLAAIFSHTSASSRRSSTISVVPRLSMSFYTRKPVEMSSLRTYRAVKKAIMRRNERLGTEGSAAESSERGRN